MNIIQMDIQLLKGSIKEGFYSSKEFLSHFETKSFRCCTVIAHISSLLLNDFMYFITQSYPLTSDFLHTRYL